MTETATETGGTVSRIFFNVSPAFRIGKKVYFCRQQIMQRFRRSGALFFFLITVQLAILIGQVLP